MPLALSPSLSRTTMVQVSAAALRDLNPYCEIKLHAGDLSGTSITPYQVAPST
jgi:hypothetical protein